MQPERSQLIEPAEPPRKRLRLRDIVGPGLITGASDDDPSGIGTYAQAGARHGTSLLWLLLLSTPMM